MKQRKILIVGDSYPLVKYTANLGYEVYCAPGDPALSDLSENLDIREDNPEELLEFVLENGIDLTIVVSEKAVKSDIASVFASGSANIFAPTAESADLLMSKSMTKKFLYKNHISTPRFAVFEKSQTALDYLKKSEYPLLISSDNCSSIRIYSSSYDRAAYHVEDLFLQDESKVVIEEYESGLEFSFYSVCDGYHVLPLTSSKGFSFSENGDGGILTSGMGAYVPSTDLTLSIQRQIFNDVILRSIIHLRDNNNPYTGIFGVDGILSGDTFKILNFRPFFKSIDVPSVLSLIGENIIEIFESCANGSFSDEYDEILMSNEVSVSSRLRSKSKNRLKVNNLMVDSEVSYLGNDTILTSKAKTLSRAKTILSDDINILNKENFKFRSDIIKC